MDCSYFSVKPKIKMCACFLRVWCYSSIYIGLVRITQVWSYCVAQSAEKCI